jgi:hypothetical protein
MQAVDAVTVIDTAGAGRTTTTEAATKIAAAESTSSGRATAFAGKRAGWNRGTTESKGDCKNNHRLTQHADLLCACTLHAPRFQGLRSAAARKELPVDGVQ